MLSHPFPEAHLLLCIQHNKTLHPLKGSIQMQASLKIPQRKKKIKKERGEGLKSRRLHDSLSTETKYITNNHTSKHRKHTDSSIMLCL